MSEILEKYHVKPPSTSGDEVLLPALLFVSMLIIGDIIAIIFVRDRPLFLIITVGILGLLVGINAVIITALVIIRKNKRNKYHIPKFDDEDLPSITEKDIERYIGYEKEVNLLRPKIVVRSSLIQADFNQEDLVYHGDIKEKHCIICRMKLDNKNVVWKCPYCVALFHKEHFLDWILENSKCPVCHGKITIII
ncbi:MAG: E3 ubiquitin protein ligase [Asgard group archaeon]|nr:E3 ubiquitin protein ligase [Asgard group archaeon]